MSGKPAALEALECMGIAAQATASALGAVSLWLIVAAVMDLPADPGGRLIQTIATVLHPGVGSVLAALATRRIGRLVTR